MEPFEIVLTVVNIAAVVLSPIIAVVIGQSLQTKSEKRRDKMQVFQCLMTRRITGWAAWESVNALNSIDIIFSENYMGFKIIFLEVLECRYSPCFRAFPAFLILLDTYKCSYYLSPFPPQK